MCLFAVDFKGREALLHSSDRILSKELPSWALTQRTMTPVNRG